tara:strand:+ start:59 stop:223 length:165 start_codon:yes stop_codon:yes gene_type:complete
MPKTATCLYTGERVKVFSLFAMRKPESFLIRYDPETVGNKSGAIKWAHVTELKF